MIIDRISIFVVSLPLEHDYSLSFGAIKSFDSVFVKIDSEDRTAWGESTPLYGYTKDSVSSVLEDTKHLSENILGKELEDAIGYCKNKGPFSRTALTVALEILAGKIRWGGGIKKVPLVYLLKGREASKIKEEVKKGSDKGYYAFKYKIGMDLTDDIKSVDAILANLPPNAKIRLDANQGYSFKEGVELITRLGANAKVELIEQPFKVKDWDGTKELSELTEIPIMLDESIANADDILKTAMGTNVKLIKLKLFKCGSFEDLVRLAEVSIKENIKVIIGNGVSTGVGCFLEAKAWDAIPKSDLAGEMNGFLKTKDVLIDNIREDNGYLEYRDVDFSRSIDESLLKKYSIHREDIHK